MFIEIDRRKPVRKRYVNVKTVISARNHLAKIGK